MDLVRTVVTAGVVLTISPRSASTWATGATDLRRSIDGLATLERESAGSRREPESRTPHAPSETARFRSPRG